MTISVQGVVARGKGEPVELTTVLVPEPGPGEALVTVQACGVCHTDLHYKEGGIGDDFPYLLGHEAAGVVEAVGPDVTDVAPGDFVILNWRAVCGRCRACSRGRPWYCFNTHNATQKMTLEDGTVLSPALGIGAFAEKTLVASGQCTKVDPAIAGRHRRAARLRRDGGHRRGDQHRRRDPRRHRGGDRLRRRRRRRDPRRPAGRRADDHRGGRGRPQAGVGARVRRHRRDQLAEHRPGGPDPGADRRLRRGRGDRGDRPAGDLRAGVLRPRPGRHRGPGRRADPGHAAGPAAARRVRPRRGAQVVLVRRLPAQPRLPDAGRPAPAGPPAAGQVRLRDHRPGRGRGGLRQDGPRRGAAQRRAPCERRRPLPASRCGPARGRSPPR